MDLRNGHCYAAASCYWSTLLMDRDERKLEGCGDGRGEEGGREGEIGGGCTDRLTGEGNVCMEKGWGQAEGSQGGEKREDWESERSETSEETMGRRTKGIREDQSYLRPSPEMLFFIFVTHLSSRQSYSHWCVEFPWFHFQRKQNLGEKKRLFWFKM